VEEPEDPDFDYSANPNAHLRAVMGDDFDPGAVIEHSDGVHLVRNDTERNMWELVVDGDGTVTFAAGLIATTDALARWIDARAAAARSDGEEEEEPAGGGPWSGGFQ